MIRRFSFSQLSAGLDSCKEVWSRDDGGDDKKSKLDSSVKDSFNGGVTKLVIAILVLAYIGEVATHGELALWGCKNNSKILQGEWWRLLSYCFVHKNLLHLASNCLSLHYLGLRVEKICGSPARYLVVFICSAIAGSVMSLWLSAASSIGVSGVTSGFKGSCALYILRNGNSKDDDGMKDLQLPVPKCCKWPRALYGSIFVLDMVICFLMEEVDHWNHVGGLIGGVASSWFVDHVLQHEYHYKSH